MLVHSRPTRARSSIRAVAVPPSDATSFANCEDSTSGHSREPGQPGTEADEARLRGGAWELSPQLLYRVLDKTMHRGLGDAMANRRVKHLARATEGRGVLAL